jgi:hypothetical protein
MGTDWRDSQIRYLVHFSDGGSGMRYRAEPLAVGAELADGGRVYRVERVEPPPNPSAFRHACVTRLDGSSPVRGTLAERRGERASERPARCARRSTDFAIRVTGTPHGHTASVGRQIQMSIAGSNPAR